jgi:hypothetical protein
MPYFLASIVERATINYNLLLQSIIFMLNLENPIIDFLLFRSQAQFAYE